MHSTCAGYHKLLDFTMLTILSDLHDLQSSSLRVILSCSLTYLKMEAAKSSDMLAILSRHYTASQSSVFQRAKNLKSR